MTESKPPRPPLGLPAGSIRALLALLIVGTVISEVIRGHRLSVSLAESLMMVLAVYFSTRRVVSVRPEVLKRLEQEGQIPAEKHPLYLPRYSIRFIILVSLLGTAVYLFQQQRLWTNEALSSLGLVGAYLVGIALRGFGILLRRWELPAALLNSLSDLRSLLVLAAVAALAACYWLSMTERLPPWGEHAALTLLLFYFGAR